MRISKFTVERYGSGEDPERSGLRVDGSYEYADSITDEQLRDQMFRAQAVLDARSVERRLKGL